MMFYKFALLFLILLLAGCPDSGRWERYSGGGSFNGTSPDMSPDQRTIIFSTPTSGKGDIAKHDIGNNFTTLLSNNPNYEGDAEFSPDGEKIVFIREENGVAKLWLMNSDGTNQTRLTKNDGYDFSPSFSPDGKKIVFSRNVSDLKFTPGTAASAEIFVIDVDGTNETRITNNEVADFEPSFSPDGKQIIFDTWAQKIWIMNTDGTNLTQIGTGASASFSPDGKQIVYVSGEFAREISVMNPDGTNTKPIVSANNYMSHPTFLNDNKTIVFLDQPNASGSGLVVQFDTTKNGRTQLLDSREPVGTKNGQPNGG